MALAPQPTFPGYTYPWLLLVLVIPILGRCKIKDSINRLPRYP